MKIVYSFLFIVVIFVFASADDTATAAPAAPSAPKAEEIPTPPEAKPTPPEEKPTSPEEKPTPPEEKPKGTQNPPNDSNPLNIWQQMAVVGGKTMETAVEAGNKVVETIMGIKPEQKPATADSWQGFLFG